ncbi:ABC1 family-domain-containing protein, partial [Ostreococcus tauri]
MPPSALASVSASAHRSVRERRTNGARERRQRPTRRTAASRRVISKGVKMTRNEMHSTLERRCSTIGAIADDAVMQTSAFDDSAASSTGAFTENDALERIVLDFSARDFSEKMEALAGRTAEVLGVIGKVYALWQFEERMGTPLEQRKRGKALRDGIARLGPVFIKMAQTLSTRPDIIGEEAADNLMVLQDKRELGWSGAVREKDASKPGPAYSLYKELSDEPVAAASIGQVYKGVMHDGTQVAVKVQRPGVLRRIALDLHIIRLGFGWIEESGLNGSEDLDKIVDEVGAGVFQELDYTIEARNADDFRRSLRFLNYIFVPRHFSDMTTKKILTQQWISGRPMKDLSLEEQKLMMFRTGLVHADPHEGNMMFTDDGKLALLDFGLICRVDDDQQEAMANCILNILNSQWGELIDNLRIMEMLPEEPQMWIDADGNPADYTQGGPGTWKVISDDEFRRAFKLCMDGEDGNAKIRSNFTELVIDLTKISTAYRFNLPPYMVFVIRSLTTLDFAAARTNCNMKALEQMLLDKDGDVNWNKLLALSAQANTASEQGGENS